MGRLLLIAALAVLACRIFTGKWPWQLWRESERAQKEAQARTLLGVERTASREAIIDAHRRLITRVHPDRGGTNEQVHAANAARDLLLDRIDRQLRG